MVVSYSNIVKIRVYKAIKNTEKYIISFAPHTSPVTWSKRKPRTKTSPIACCRKDSTNGISPIACCKKDPTNGISPIACCKKHPAGGPSPIVCCKSNSTDPWAKPFKKPFGQAQKKNPLPGLWTSMLRFTWPVRTSSCVCMWKARRSRRLMLPGLMTHVTVILKPFHDAACKGPLNVAGSDEETSLLPPPLSAASIVGS